MTRHPVPRRWRSIPAALLVVGGVAVVAACGSAGSAAAGSATTAAVRSPAATSSATASATPAATTTSSATASNPTSSAGVTGSGTTGGRPSATAAMVCGDEISEDVETALQLKTAPPTSSTYVDQLFSCTYQLQGGPFVLSVKDTTTVPAATAYYDAVRRSHPDAKTITGVESLGLTSFETPSGVVMFLKDDKTLTVDATRLPAANGPADLSRSDLAYQIATDVIGCWREH